MTDSYRVVGDLPAHDVTDWLQQSPIAAADEVLHLNWRIVNEMDRTVVAFAGGGSKAIADYVCDGLNNDQVFNKG